MRHRSVRIVLLALLVVAGSLVVGVGRAAAIGFTPKTDYATGAGPWQVASGDFNGDGKTDLAVANGTANTVSVLLGNGNGTFQAKVDYPTGTLPFGVAVGDFNGDGKQDLVTVSGSDNSVSILLGAGNGTFGAKADFATGTNPYAVAMGDVNGDGKPDVVTANNSDTVSVLLNTAAGALGFATHADYPTGAGTYCVAIGDLNGDGRPDLATANFTAGTASVLLGTGGGAFSAKTDYPAGAGPVGVAIGDVNGDGKADLAVANNTASTASVLLGDGSGALGAKSDFATGDRPFWVSIADLDGDGKQDLATANDNANTVSVLLNASTSAVAFAAKTDFATGTGPVNIAIADLNGDGRPDLATANHDAGTVGTLLSTLPSGTIAVTGGAAYTNQATVGLDLTSTGAVQMRTHDEAVAWGTWQPLATHLTWVLSAGDGTKTMSVQYQNASGVSRVATATIARDTQGPVTSGAKVKVVKGKKAVFKFTITEPAPGGPTTSADPAKPVKIVIRNARRKVVKTLTATTPCATNKSVSLTWKKCTLKRGSYSYKVYATDLAGNAQRKAGGNKLVVR